MSRDDPNSSEANSSVDPSKADLRYQGFARQVEGSTDADAEPEDLPATDASPEVAPDALVRRGSSRKLRIFGLACALVIIFAAAAFFAGRELIRSAMHENLPQLDGSLTVYGLAATVTVARDARGVPHIHANSMDDLVFVQGYITAGDRLWQMDLLRRHAAGQLAAILGRTLLDHDRLQRTLQLRASAERAISVLPADQRHWLEVYARGVNASIAAQRTHLPVEFRLLGYRPAPWTPRDSVLIELVMFQDLTTGYPSKLGREALAAHLSPELIADLYPVGSWRDHYPGQPMPDVSAPQPEFNDIPLDESQSKLLRPAQKPGAPGLDSQTWVSTATTSPFDLLALRRTLALFHTRCDACVAGSNAWAVSGSRSISGKPVLANDMHLSLSAPELWYEADLEAANPAPLAAFHAAGVTLPARPSSLPGTTTTSPGDSPT